MQHHFGGGNTPGRRTAAHNYIDTSREPSLQHLTSFQDTPGLEFQNFPTEGAEAARHGPFELLQRKFGFQQSSVANQKEHFGCWFTNYQYRLRNENKVADVEGEALDRVHAKFLKNYVKWCEFLRVKPHGAEAHDGPMKERQIALFLLMWGEAGNIRFMPECLCFLYHSVSYKLSNVETLPDVEEGFYLKEIIRPVYKHVAQMKTASAPEGKRPLDHKDIINYDDVNEFFWTKTCLDFDERNVSQALAAQEHKTFKEKRSVFNPLLGFFRLWYFLLVVFHLQVAIVYIAYRSDPDSTSGFMIYSKFFSSGQKKTRLHALYSVMMTVTGLLMVKAGLQIWLYGIRTFKNPFTAMGIFIRFAWHTIFFCLFLLVFVSPNENFALAGLSSALPGGGEEGTYLASALSFLIIYLIPVLMSSVTRMCFGRFVWSVSILNGLDGTNQQYVGRDMGQPWHQFGMYGLSWTVIFLCKFLFSLQLMIKPLVGPSVEIWDLPVPEEQKAKGVLESNHNIGFILALWAPVLVVYMYDLQIWFILYQSVVGMIMGFRLKLGHYGTLLDLQKGLYLAPSRFDNTISSDQAKKQKPMGDRESLETPVLQDMKRLRFAIIWNEVVSSFRLNDLLDDRETVMLQYRLLRNGERVEDPIFLLAGKLPKAIEIASEAHSHNVKTTPDLVNKIAAIEAMDAVRHGVELFRDIIFLLLGDKDGENVLQILDYFVSAQDVMSLVDFQYMSTLNEQLLELLTDILDLPEDVEALESTSSDTEPLRAEFHSQVSEIVRHLRDMVGTIELMVNDETVVSRLRRVAFLDSSDLTFQKEQLLALYKADAFGESTMFTAPRRQNSMGLEASSRHAREAFMSSCTRLFFLLKLDVSNALPRGAEAKRRMGFFLHSLSMEMPTISSLEAMPSFSVMTPYYSETVMFTLAELSDPVNSNPLFEAVDKHAKAKGQQELSIMKYLITFHAEEWSNFLERMGLATLDEALEAVPREVRLWASLRGQTLARTVQGMMMYEDAIRLLRWMELFSADMSEADKVVDMDRISSLKFSYITGCQIYSAQAAKGDHRADDIDYLMKKYPSWRVSFVDTIELNDGDKRFDCVLAKSEGDEIVEVYRYELPGNPILGEGKPENQNVALVFTRGEYLQTIDMNQEHYFEECLKMPNFLATSVTETGEEVTVIGMKEHVFTGRASSLARFMTLQELVFVTLTQRVLAKPLRSRMHYGHPDVFEKSFVMTSGGVSKASKGINLSEDVFSGYNVTLRGGLVTHVEFMQCGKGRDVTLSQINAFEAKLSNGCAESCLSREGHRMSSHLDFFRLNSMFYGHFGFYICNALTVFCVFVYAYSKLYVGTHVALQEDAVAKSDSMASLSAVLGTQYVLQFGMLTTLPLMATLVVEFGFKNGCFQIFELFATMGIVFYVFLTGTKAHFFDVALLRGGSKYRATGRGFNITRDPMVSFFKEYGVSHFRKAVELIGIMGLYGLYANFSLGVDALDDFCENADFDCKDEPEKVPENITNLAAYGSSGGQSFGLASFAVLLLGSCWLMAPFIFNTDGLVLAKTNIDISNWFAWMMRVRNEDEVAQDEAPATAHTIPVPKDGWIEWWKEDVDLNANLGGMGRLTYCLRELRFPIAMYYVFTTQFSLGWLGLLVPMILGAWFMLWFGNRMVSMTMGSRQKSKLLMIRGIVYMVGTLSGLTLLPLIICLIAGWSMLKAVTLTVCIILGLNTICQYGVAMHGVYGFKVAHWRPISSLGFLMDIIVSVFLVLPLFILSLLPFMRILQTRMMYNGGFSRALSSGSEVAASLAILMGLLVGFIFGFMKSFLMGLGYVNDPSDNFINKSFYYFVTETFANDGKNYLDFMSNGYAKLIGAVASILAIAISYGLGKLLGRKWNICIGAILIAVSLGLNFTPSTGVITASIALANAGSAMVFMNYLLWAFEICTKGWRGKSVGIFLLGAMMGYLVHNSMQASSDITSMSEQFSNKPQYTWCLQPIYVVAPMLFVLFVALWFLPESPVWLIARGKPEPARESFVTLRRRQKVDADIKAVQDEMTGKIEDVNMTFRIAFTICLQAMFGLFLSQAMLPRLSVEKEDEDGDEKGTFTNRWPMYFGMSCGFGLAFGSILVDNVRRKTLLKDFTPFLALASLIAGIADAATGGKSDASVQVIAVMIYVVSGLSLLNVSNLSALEMFPMRRRTLFFCISLCVSYVVQGLVYFLSPSLAATMFVFCVCCMALTVVLFLYCASTKQGAIQLKGEKRRQKEREAAEARQRAEAGEDGPKASGGGKMDQQRRRRIMQAIMNSRAVNAFTPNTQGQRLPPELHHSHSGSSQFSLSTDATSTPYNRSTTPTSDRQTEQEWHYSQTFNRNSATYQDGPQQTSEVRTRPTMPAQEDSLYEGTMIEELENLPDNLFQEQISYPANQPRSQSLLQSRQFPDSELEAETNSRVWRM